MEVSASVGPQSAVVENPSSKVKRRTSEAAERPELQPVSQLSMRTVKSREKRQKGVDRETHKQRRS